MVKVGWSDALTSKYPLDPNPLKLNTFYHSGKWSHQSDEVQATRGLRKYQREEYIHERASRQGLRNALLSKLYASRVIRY